MIIFSKLPDVLTVKQTADVLQVSPKSVYKLIHDNLLAARKIGSTYRISKRALIDFLQK